MWISVAFVSVLLYATAETFQKKSSVFKEEHSELKLLICFGIISGLVSALIFLFGLKETDVTFFSAIKSSPSTIVSPLFYYLSLFLSFLALKLIPLSLAAVVICSDGVLTFVGVVIMYLIMGNGALLDESITPLKLALVALSFLGIFVCAALQNKAEDREENKKLVKKDSVFKSGCFAVAGVLFAFLSASLDASSSLADIYFLTDEFEIFDYLYIHGILIFLFTIILYVALLIKEGRAYNPFSKSQLPKILGGGCDGIGLVFYMIAVNKNPIYTNVLISSSCVFTVIFSRVFLKERMEKKQVFWTVFTIVCIVAFAIVDEMF